MKNLFNNSIDFVLTNTLLQDITSIDRQIELVTEYHTTTHNGITETLKHLQRHYYWPKMDKLITKIINTCETCLTSKYERKPLKPTFRGPLLTDKPFHTVHMDTYTIDKTMFLTIIDAFSKFALAYQVNDLTSLTLTRKLKHYFMHYGFPVQIKCDPGTEFKAVFKEFCNLYGIHLHYTTPNNSNSNSLIERFHSTPKEKYIVLKTTNPTGTVNDRVTDAVLVYNQSVHSSTGYTAFHIIFGPYEHKPEFDTQLTLYDNYVQQHKDHIQPFVDQIYEKAYNKEKKVLDIRNETRGKNIPTELPSEVFVKTSSRIKSTPPFKKITNVQQTSQGITGKASKKTVKIPLSKIKPLRLKPLLQDNDTDSSDDQSTAED